MTISNSTAPTSIIPKPSDVSHIQMVAAQTIFRFPSFLTLLISLSLGAGTAWCRWRGSNPHEFQSTPLMRRETTTKYIGLLSRHRLPLPSCEGRPKPPRSSGNYSYFNPLPSCEGRLLSPRSLYAYDIFQSTPLIRGETSATQFRRCAYRHFNPLPSYEGRPYRTERGRW